jgi:hypothetical protein
MLYLFVKTPTIVPTLALEEAKNANTFKHLKENSAILFFHYKGTLSQWLYN